MPDEGLGQRRHRHTLQPEGVHRVEVLQGESKWRSFTQKPRAAAAAAAAAAALKHSEFTTRWTKTSQKSELFKKNIKKLQ